MGHWSQRVGSKPAVPVAPVMTHGMVVEKWVESSGLPGSPFWKVSTDGFFTITAPLPPTILDGFSDGS